MTDKQPRNHAVIMQSLLWAAAMIGTAFLLKGTEHQKDVFFLLLVLSTTGILSFNARGRDPLDRAVCRLLGRTKRAE